MKHLQRLFWMLALCASIVFASNVSHAQEREHGTSAAESVTGHANDAENAPRGESGHANDGHSAGHEGEHSASPFDPHAGTWLNPVARAFSGESAPQVKVEAGGEAHITNPNSIKYDVYLISALVLLGIGLVGVSAGKKARLRPEGKANSLGNTVEAAVEGFYNYLVGIMGRDLANKYTPLIGTFFFTILICNWLGLVPGLVAPTSNANVPIALAIIAFFATHIIAIKEVGVGPWFMHFVGEPKWLAFLNFPLHIIGELIKPLSLAIRLLCNVFGEEMVIIQLTTMAAVMLPMFLPIPFQFPIMCLGVFFGALQALVFSTLLAIYISILATHHDDHGGHGHVEHVEVNGHPQTVAHGTQTSVA